MEPKFNIDRPKLSDDEINKQKDFNRLIEQFKRQSLQKARQDKSWWKNKKVRYSTVIAGAAVVCTITLLSLYKDQIQKNTSNETLTTLTAKHKTNPEEPKGRCVNSPSSKLNLPYSSYKVSNQKGGEIKHSTSSRIKIQKNSFVDKNGIDIVGDVTIEYREMHDKSDIIASGVPMAYDSAGKKYNLETAGMFEIKGSQNGEPVFIKKYKTLQVELASASAENRFNQYYLDTVERNWKYVKKDHATPVKQARHKENSPEKITNPKIESLTNEAEVVIPKRIDSVKVAYTGKVQSIPKPKEPTKPNKPSGRQTFNIDADSKEFPELASFGNLLFEIGAENKNYSSDLGQITWSDAKISEGPQKGKNYWLTLSYRSRVEKLIVYPVLSGKDLEKAQQQYEQKFEVYKGLAAKKEADEKKLIAEMEAKQKAYQEQIAQIKADIAKERNDLLARMATQEINELAYNYDKMTLQVRSTRLFEITRFGIHNSDCAKPIPDGRSISPVFAVDEKSKPVFPDVVYLVDHNKNSVYTFYKGYNTIPYDPQNNNSFVIFTKQKMYVCNREDFKESSDNDSNKFKVKSLSEKDDLVSLKKALEI